MQGYPTAVVMRESSNNDASIVRRDNTSAHQEGHSSILILGHGNFLIADEYNLGFIRFSYLRNLDPP